MSVDSAALLAVPPLRLAAAYNTRDLLVYAVGIGAADLQFTYEFHERFAAFPLYPVVLLFKGDSPDVVSYPPRMMVNFPEGFPTVNPANILHGEQSVELFRTLPTEGARLMTETRTISFLSKGSGTLMENETIISDGDGPVAKLVAGWFIRGLSGFEGKGRTPPPRVKIPDREPDAREVDKTLPTQTQLYRLSGDYNALHIDPKTAQSVGFDQPILHGLCTMGFTSRALYKHFCNGDTSRFKSIRVRFTSPTIPGETLETQMWSEGSTVYFRTIAQERQKVVIDGGEFILSE